MRLPLGGGMDLVTAVSAYLDDVLDTTGGLAADFDAALDAAPDVGVFALTRLRRKLDALYRQDGWEPPESTHDPDLDTDAALPSAASVDEDRAVLRARAQRASADAAALHEDLADSREEFEALREELRQLRAALRSRAIIEQAKGIVMGRFGISADAAWNYLVRRSQTENVKIRDLAGALVVGTAAGQPDMPDNPAAT